MTTAEKFEARRAGIIVLEKYLYGENFLDRCQRLLDKLKEAPEGVVKETIEWLGPAHPFTIRIEHQALIQRRETEPQPRAIYSLIKKPE